MASSRGGAIMTSAFKTVRQIRAAVEALPFACDVYSITVSHRAAGAIVTVQRERGDFASWEWSEVNPAQLYWGHYGMTELEAESDHAKRCARLQGVAA